MSKKRVGVIGSGFGGLATAIRLQAASFSTTILEKREGLGGRAYVYREKGFTFDAGPTVITAPECIEELFAVAQRPMQDYVELVPVTPFYRLRWEDGYYFDYCDDEEKLLEQIRLKHPPDVEGYKAFYEYSKQVYQAGYKDLVHVPFLSFWDMVKVAPELIRLQAYRSVYKTVSRYVQDEQLRQAFSFHSLLIGGNPFASSSIYTLIHALERKGGVFFPKGGTNALVAALGKLFQDLGGEIRLSCGVQKILTEGGDVTGVQTEAGEVLGFDAVVSNADVTYTYENLLAAEPRAKNMASRLKRKRYSQSLFVVYFGTDRLYPELAHHTILFGPRYKALLDDIFYRGVLPEDFSIYLHAPCRTDASLAPSGCDTFYALVNVPHLGKLDPDWEKQGEPYARAVLNYLEKQCLPDLNKHLVVQRHFSPLDFKQTLNAYMGSAFSLEPTLMQSAYFRTPNRDSQIAGLYFVGAGTHPGAGLPGVINSAKATTGVLMNDYASVAVGVGEPLRAQ